jgi:hypothetical protein
VCSQISDFETPEHQICMQHLEFTYMHPSNCKISDRIHPCMIQLYGGSSQPASAQPASGC